MVVDDVGIRIPVNIDSYCVMRKNRTPHGGAGVINVYPMVRILNHRMVNGARIKTAVIKTNPVPATPGGVGRGRGKGIWKL